MKTMHQTFESDDGFGERQLDFAVEGDTIIVGEEFEAHIPSYAAARSRRSVIHLLEHEARWLRDQIDVALGEGKPWAEQCAKLIEQAQALLLRNAEPDSLGFCTKRTSALAGTLEDVALMVRGE